MSGRDARDAVSEGDGLSNWLQRRSFKVTAGSTEQEQKDAAVKFLASVANKDTMEARDSEHGITALGHAVAWGYSVAVDLLLIACK